MTTHRQPLPSLPHWLFWCISLVLTINTALITLLVLQDTLALPFVVYGIGLVLPPSLAGLSVVLWLTMRTHQLAQSLRTGAGLVSIGQAMAIPVNVLAVNALWQASRPPCQIQCGNASISATLEIAWPFIGMLCGLAAAALASLAGWLLLRLLGTQKRQVEVPRG